MLPMVGDILAKDPEAGALMVLFLIPVLDIGGHAFFFG